MRWIAQLLIFIANDGRPKVVKDELWREPSRIGALSALGAVLSFELAAAVEAFCFFGFGLLLSLYFGLCFVLHNCFDMDRNLGKQG